MKRMLRLFIAAAILLGWLLPLVLYRSALFPPPVAGVYEALPVRVTGLFEQWLVMFTAFGVKPTYMILSLLWIVWLWRRRATDLAALRQGLIWFLGGETACAVNYLFFAGHSYFTDYLHSYGMVVGFSFVAYALLEAVDVRLIRYSPPKERCAALSLCRSCIKYTEAPCGLQRVFTMLLPALIVVAFMPLCAGLKVVAYRTQILNSLQDYSYPAWSQLFEDRYCAWLAIVLLGAAWLVLLLKKEEPVALAKILLAAASGPLGFGLMRLFLRTGFSDDLVWANIWEELTELIFVVAVGFVLWVFRHGLFREELGGLRGERGTQQGELSSTTDGH